MKKILIALTAILAFTSFQSGKTSTVANSSNEKVTICHREGNGSSHTITVSINAVPAHMAHGDLIGECGGPSISE